MLERIKAIVNSTRDKIPHLECDGATRVLNYLFTKEGIPHQVMMGGASLGEKTISHYWIEAEGHIIDLKIKMWLGDTVTEGVFTPDGTQVEYDGRHIQMKTSDIVYRLLMRTSI
jgi:hypothetical protein